jgi:hypothetical protein
MGLEKTTHIQLRHPTHSSIFGKKSKRVRWPTPVAGISEITYKQNILSERNGGAERLGDSEVEGWMDL